MWEDRVRWGSGCTWLDYDRDGFLDLFVCNYIELDLQDTAGAGADRLLPMERHSGDVRPARPAGRMNILYHNNGNGTFTDVSEEAGILKPGPRYSITAVSYDFDNDGWPDIYVAVDSEPSILFHNKHDGTFEDVAVMAGCAYNEDGQEQAGMGVGVGDYDGDGWLDIFKTNFSDDTPIFITTTATGRSRKDFRPGLGVNTQYVCWGAALWTTTTMAGQTSFTSPAMFIRKLRSIPLGRRSRLPRLVYRNLGNGKFKDVSKDLGPASANDFPAAARFWRLRQ